MEEVSSKLQDVDERELMQVSNSLLRSMEEEEQDQFLGCTPPLKHIDLSQAPTPALDRDYGAPKDTATQKNLEIDYEKI